MLNHTYTSVKNANLVDCGKKQHIPSQPTPLLKENFLGEFRTELDKKKVLAALGIATELSLEWGNIGGEVGDSDKLMAELDARTKYTSALDGMSKTIGEGIKYLESIVGGEEEGEAEQDRRISEVEEELKTLQGEVTKVQTYLTDTVDVNIEELQKGLESINTSIENITSLINVSKKDGNALILLTEEDDVDNPGLYVPDLSEEVSKIAGLSDKIDGIATSLGDYVTKNDLGTGPYKFVSESTFDGYKTTTDTAISNINSELSNTIKKGADGNVNTLGVNKITNSSKNIEIDRSLERTTNAPLDIYCVRNSLQELYALDPEVCYSGMGVIVTSDDPALYILRDPKGQEINSEYVQNKDNWKCPEDLVTVALSRDQYNDLVNKGKTSDHIFYYVYEDDEIEYEPKPLREDYESDADYLAALDLWINHKLLLPQEYLSAQWGVGIEEKVAKKANQTDVNTLDSNIKDLEARVDLISGGANEDSVSSIANRLKVTESELDYLLGTEGTDEEFSSKGKISEIEDSISELDATIKNDYVSIDSITTENNNTDYIFVKKLEYESDKLSHNQAIAKSVTTDSLNTNSITLSDLPVTSNGTDLFINNKEVALTEKVPVIIYLTQTKYDDLASSGELDSEAYYYTTSEETYVTKTELDAKVDQLNLSIDALNTLGNGNNTSITNMQSQIQTLLGTVAALEARIAALEGSTKTTTN